MCVTSVTPSTLGGVARDITPCPAPLARPLRAALGVLTVSALVGALALASTPDVQATSGAAAVSPVDAAPGAAVQGALDNGARTTSFSDGWQLRAGQRRPASPTRPAPTPTRDARLRRLRAGGG